MRPKPTYGNGMIVGVILLLMSLEDLYHMEVSDILQLCLLLFIIITTKPSLVNIIVALAFLGIYIIYERNCESKIGGADVKILCSLYILGGIEMIIRIMFIASLFGIVFSVLLNKKKIPFVPFIWIGYLLVNI